MDAETVAIIDLGTNTFHLLITEVNDRDDFTVKEKFKEPVKLGEGGINKGTISPAAFRRGIEVLKRFRKLIIAKRASRVFAYGTSAIRSAGNGQEFVEQARKEAEIDIRVINGNEEAALIFEGIRNGIPLPYEENTLCIDIGGGSVEFVVSRENKPLLIRSLDIGAARMLELINPADPITQEEREKAALHLKNAMRGLIRELKEFEINLLVGSSGTFETLASMIAHRKRDLLSAENLNNYSFTSRQFRELFKKLVTLNREERLSIPGMDAMRVDMIVMGAILVDLLLTELRITQIRTCLFALKEGILFRYLEEKRQRVHHLIGNVDRDLRAKAIRNLGERYSYDREHVLKVSEIALSLFDQLQHLHQLGPTEKELLKYGCLLHDIGHFINRSGHHKHGQYLIMHSPLSGFSNDELLMLGNIVRYHRKSLPTREHFYYKVLSEEYRYMIRVLAGILRVADHLDRGHRNLVNNLIVHTNSEQIHILVEAEETIDIEISSAIKQKELLEKTMEREVLIQQA